MNRIFPVLILTLAFASVAFAHEDENYVFHTGATKTAIRGDVAVYNLSNAKLHSHDCEWAEKCVKNCIFVDKKELKNIFYIPCMVCGGGTFPAIALEEE